MVAEGKIEAHWRAYLETLPDEAPERREGYEVWGFGDGPEMAEELETGRGRA